MSCSIADPGGPGHPGRPFTLIEVLAAMLVLLIMMGVLFQFLGSAQRVWSLTDTNTRIHENARVLFDIITRDLQSVVASGEAGREIPFYVGDSDGDTNAPLLAFVSAVGPASGVHSRLCEIHYDCYSSGGEDKWHYWFRRARTCDRLGSDADTMWDFYGDTASTDWVDSRQSFQRVVDGVAEIKVEHFGLPTPAPSPPVFTTLPKAVRVTVSLFDPKLATSQASEAARKRTMRTFTKTIFLRTQS